MALGLRGASAIFCTHPLWEDAVWFAATYRCHPSSEAPPVMGLLFANWQVGLRLFSVWTDECGHVDEIDGIRILFVEGNITGRLPGYSIRISAAGSDEPGQVQRVHPTTDCERLFPDFKAQYLQHGEFLLCPVVEKDDGQLWFNANAGIIKHHIEFRNADEIDPDDPDAVVLQPTESETALRELTDAMNQVLGESSNN